MLLLLSQFGLFQDFRQQPDEAISVALARLFRDINSESGGSCHNPHSVLEAVCRRCALNTLEFQLACVS